MIKRLFSVLLLLFMLNFCFWTAPVQSKDYNANLIIDAEFKTDFNVNKASKGEIVQFISTQDYTTDGIVIPTGTIFNGEVKHYKKGSWGYRRAKAIIAIDKMILPNGQTYNIKASTKRHVLKGSALANIGKGVISFPVAIVVGVTGAVVIVVEAISVAGLLAIGPTSYLFGRIMGTLTHGVNYKKNEGDDIQIKLKTIKNTSF